MDTKFEDGDELTKGKLGTTTCQHGTPTDQACAVCHAGKQSDEEAARKHALHDGHAKIETHKRCMATGLLIDPSKEASFLAGCRHKQAEIDALAEKVKRLEALPEKTKNTADELARVLRMHDRWQMDYGGEAYYDGCMQSDLSESTEIALGMHANLSDAKIVNECDAKLRAGRK